MRKIIWTKRALSRLDAIGARISSDNPDIAKRIVERIYSGSTGLATFPQQGRAGRIAGTRELVFPDIPYILPYRIKETAIEILTVMHTSQKWPDKL